MMRSALYYPHTEVKSSSLLKTSLLLWDKLQYIVPSPEYEPYYEDPLVKEAIGLIGEAHFPTAQEKEEAHSQIESLVKRQPFQLHSIFPIVPRLPTMRSGPRSCSQRHGACLEEAGSLVAHLLRIMITRSACTPVLQLCQYWPIAVQARL